MAEYIPAGNRRQVIDALFGARLTDAGVLAEPTTQAQRLNFDPRTIRSYEPTWKEKIAQALIGDRRPSPEKARFVEGLVGSSGLGSKASLVDFTPLGNVLGYQEAPSGSVEEKLALLPAAAMVKGGFRQLASRSTSIYNPPVKPQRAFEADYTAKKFPDGVPHDPATGRLTYDLDRRPIDPGARMVGRKVVGGQDEALPSAELDALAEAILGSRPALVQASALRRGDVGAYDPNTGRTLVYRGLTPDQGLKVAAHEVSHGINDKAGELVGLRRANQIPITPGMQKELRPLYNDLNNYELAQARKLNPDVEPKTVKWGTGTKPESFGYKGDDVPAEYMAEAVRAYLANPNYIKEMAPETAAQARKFVNDHPLLNKKIHLNSLAGGAAGSAALIEALKGYAKPGHDSGA